MGLSSTDIT